MGAEGGLPAALLPAGRAGGHGAEANMVVSGKKNPSRRASRRSRKRRSGCSSAASLRPSRASPSFPAASPTSTPPAHLDAINRIGGLPWKVSFSYGRGPASGPQQAWSGKADNVAAAQKAFSHRAEMNSSATLGQWKKGAREGGLRGALEEGSQAPARQCGLARLDCASPARRTRKCSAIRISIRKRAFGQYPAGVNRAAAGSTQRRRQTAHPPGAWSFVGRPMTIIARA